MLFNSFEFLIFFPTVVALYFGAPARSRWAILLAASYAFYAFWRVEYLLLILLSTSVDYAAAICMERARTQTRRRLGLLASLVSNLGLLITFKYFDFLSASFAGVAGWFGLPYGQHSLALLLPVGISFYTFQTLSYSIDVYRGQMPAERHFGRFALYVAFFPQLVAGPIERSTRLLPQFWQSHGFDYDRVVSGLRRMAWGLIKKVVIADRLAVLVDHVYYAPDAFTGLPLIVATYAFAIQIYCDFSGYTDIAIGAARVFGFDLMENFRRPYAASSFQDFWKRWHISLSSWFRDYLYIPLGGSRVTVPHWVVNVLIVFVLSGLWHGANWTFAAWGAVHGVYLMVGRFTYRLRQDVLQRSGWSESPALRLFQVVITFHLTCLAWIFFRADSIQDAFYVLSHLIPTELRFSGYGLGLTQTELLLTLLAVVGMDLVERARERGSLSAWFRSRPLAWRWTAYYSAIFVLFFFGKFGRNEFIYFQF